MSTPNIQTQQYALLFKDGSGNPQPGINVLIFPAGADTSQLSNAIDGGTTDATGTYLTAPLGVGVMYAFTTTGAVASGTFFAAISNAMPIVIDPTHTSGSYPGSSSGGLTTVPSPIRLAAFLTGYSLDPAAPIGTNAVIKSSFQTWGKNGPPAGLHFADSASGLSLGGLAVDYINFSGVADPNAAVTSPPIIGYSVDALIRFHSIVFNSAVSTAASVALIVNMQNGGKIHSQQPNVSFAPVVLYFNGDQVNNGNAYADARVKEIIAPSSGGTFAPFTFQVQAQDDVAGLLTGSQCRIWLDLTLTPLFA